MCVCVCVCVCVVDNTNYVSFQNQNIKANLLEIASILSVIDYAMLFLFSNSKYSKQMYILLIDFCSKMTEAKTHISWL